MSLARLRRSSRAVAALLLLVSAFGLPHRSQGDEVCTLSGVEQHDESKHVFTRAEQIGHEDHCAVCHWMRWYKPVLSSRGSSDRGPDTGLPLTSPAAPWLRGSATDQLPARAPPSELI